MGENAYVYQRPPSSIAAGALSQPRAMESRFLRPYLFHPSPPPLCPRWASASEGSPASGARRGATAAAADRMRPRISAIPRATAASSASAATATARARSPSNSAGTRGENAPGLPDPCGIGIGIHAACRCGIPCSLVSKLFGAKSGGAAEWQPLVCRSGGRGAAAERSTGCIDLDPSCLSGDDPRTMGRIDDHRETKRVCGCL